MLLLVLFLDSTLGLFSDSFSTLHSDSFSTLHSDSFSGLPSDSFSALPSDSFSVYPRIPSRLYPLTPRLSPRAPSTSKPSPPPPGTSWGFAGGRREEKKRRGGTGQRKHQFASKSVCHTLPDKFFEASLAKNQGRVVESNPGFPPRLEQNALNFPPESHKNMEKHNKYSHSKKFARHRLKKSSLRTLQKSGNGGRKKPCHKTDSISPLDRAKNHFTPAKCCQTSSEKYLRNEVCKKAGMAAERNLGRKQATLIP